MTASLLMSAGGLLLAAMVFGPRFSRLWLLFILAGTASGLGAACNVLAGADWEWRSAFKIGHESLHFRLDGISSLFVMLLCVLGGAGAAYSREYWPDRKFPSAARGRFWWAGILLSMALVLINSNGLHFLIAWELFTVCSYFLIMLDGMHVEVRKAGWLFLVSSHAGTVFLFAFFGALAAQTGTWDLGPMQDQIGLAPLFWLALVGFGVKAALFPLHVWLPSAHANAPSHVSAIMSGVAIKMGVYGLIRFSGWMPLPPASGWVVLGLGALSAVLGIGFALVQTDLKRLLAYCSVENVGIILIGLGGAVLGKMHGQASWTRLAIAGALLHVLNHGLYKSLLFFSAGSVLHATGTREMSRLGGLWRRMPWTAAFFLIGSLAVAGLPPLNGLVSEWLIYLGLFDAAMARGPIFWAAMPAVILLGLAGALALAAFSKAATVVFLGTPRTRLSELAHECGSLMRGPMLLLGAICLLIGLVPSTIWPLVHRAALSWNPALQGAERDLQLSNLGAVNLTLAVCATFFALLMWRVVTAKSIRRGLTWDCGYASPTARMQYTSASFSGIAGSWLVWLMRPELKIRRPRGPFPDEALRLQKMPEPVLERIILPISELIARVSSAVRRLQHGRLQAYILYVAAGLVGLGILVWLGGAP